MKTSRLVWFLILPLCFSNVEAQVFQASVVASSGEHFESPAGMLTWTLGEVVTETFAQKKVYLTQGFQQPTSIIVTELEDADHDGPVIFPIPVRDFLHIESKEDGANYQVELFNLQGQRLVNEPFGDAGQKRELILDMQDFRVAMYLLRIINVRTQKVYTVKIEKY
jgi:Secretion system C-terminal sorting domain